jgi:hypothetical protein
MDSATYPLANGTLVEARLRFESVGAAEPLIVAKTWLVDEENGFMWSVECAAHESIAAGLAAACTNINRSLVPFGPIVP